jgi:hypothetical protein
VAVASLLELDEPVGDDRRSFADAIRSAMQYGSYGRSLGEVSPRCAATAERAQAAADELKSGSPGARLFAEVAASARGEIERDRRADDEETLGWH